MKRNEIVMYATTWINLENLLRDERIQKNMTTYYMILFTWNSNFQMDKKQISVARG